MATRTKIKLEPLVIDGHAVGRVLITGASAGIGAELARAFARGGHQLTLVARRRAKLEALAVELEREHYVEVRTIVQDLTKPNGAAAVIKAAEADGHIGILVNNAGVIDVGPFAASSTDALVDMVDLNVRALTELTSLVVPGMVKRGFGRILNVASLAAFQAIPGMATYAATKAFVLALTEALSEELKGSGVSATALCPGITDTDMATDIQAGTSAKLPKQLISDPADVAAEGVKALMAGQAVVVPGLPNQITAAWAQVTPHWLTRYIAGFAARRADWLTR
ncbi:MAG: SDR family oxidoreductase [Rhizobacter sp.]|nr:SDR family oxidoreductase [Rhizobacter sp.]